MESELSFEDVLTPEILGRYLDRRESEVSKCIEALGRDDFSKLREVAHKIRGNCTTFGFNELAPMAEDLESSARGKDPRRCLVILSELDRWVKAKKNVVQTMN